jgi:hypothetical protein
VLQIGATEEEGGGGREEGGREEEEKKKKKQKYSCIINITSNEMEKLSRRGSN